MYLSTVDCKRISQVFSPQLGVSCFLYRGSVISQNSPVRTCTGDKQDVCPGYDDSGDAPIGCFNIKDDLITMGVIHQQLILLEQEGMVWNGDHVELRVIKYRWQRGFLLSKCSPAF